MYGLSNSMIANDFERGWRSLFYIHTYIYIHLFESDREDPYTENTHTKKDRQKKNRNIQHRKTQKDYRQYEKKKITN